MTIAARGESGSFLAPIRRVPGFLHDGVVTLLEQHPELLLDAWSRSGGPADARDYVIGVLPNELRITFASHGIRHLRPDIVMRFDRPGQRSRFGSAEIVATRSRRRAATWQTHGVLLEQLYGERDAPQLILPLGPTMARWVTREIGGRPGIRHMCMVGPDKLARSETLDDAITRPYHAALAIAALRGDATRQMCEVALQALGSVRDPYAGDYIRMILTAVPRPLMEELLMSIRERTLKIDAADRQGYLYSKAFEDGQREGQLVGQRVGQREGQREGQLVTIERVLVARELPVAPSLRARLRECSDERLERATLLAVTASSIDEFEALLFGGSSTLDG